MQDVNQSSPSLKLITPTGWKDYELLDSGNGEKLERFGSYIIIRPEHQALWRPALSERIWSGANARFISTGEESGGHWSYLTPMPKSWAINYHGINFFARLSNSRHVGFFPEQAAHWDWISTQIKDAGRKITVLNLFGYTGVATLAAAKAGAVVTHVDASKKSIIQAKENQKLSNLESAPIRWIVDDVIKYVQREVRRGIKYQGIIMDPPKFGRGPKGEVWEFFDKLPQLLRELTNLLGDNPIFLIITAYAIRASALTLFYSIQDMMSGTPGQIESGELISTESSAGRQISQAIYARWLASDA